MMVVQVAAPEGPIRTTVELPASKSISNRALIVRALAGGNLPIRNLSAAKDTEVLIDLLSSTSHELNCGEGGTTLRFMLAYLAAKGGTFRITAAPSLMARPLTPLLQALTRLGCSFSFEEAEGKLPFTMSSSGLQNSGILELPGDVSSQFISALMMIGPYVKQGLTIRMQGEVLSFPYIRMTAKVMAAYGVSPEVGEREIVIPPGIYQPVEYAVEPDWSAASYWFEIAALRRGSEIILPGLRLQSLQGDAAISDMMKHLGVQATETSHGLVVTQSGTAERSTLFQADLSGCPDTAPALICTSAGLGVTADFPGLKNFRLKETDRAAAFQREIYNFGVHTDFCGGSKFKVYGGKIRPSSRIIKTYKDHRVAMAIAPLSLVAGPVKIEEPEVVAKSYPHFFDDLRKAGFVVQPLESGQ